MVTQRGLIISVVVDEAVALLEESSADDDSEADKCMFNTRGSEESSLIVPCTLMNEQPLVTMETMVTVPL